MSNRLRDSSSPLAPKKRRGRPRKEITKEVSGENVSRPKKEQVSGENVSRPRGRPKKEQVAEEITKEVSGENVRKPRGRPKKEQIAEEITKEKQELTAVLPEYGYHTTVKGAMGTYITKITAFYLAAGKFSVPRTQIIRITQKDEFEDAEFTTINNEIFTTLEFYLTRNDIDLEELFEIMFEEQTNFNDKIQKIDIFWMWYFVRKPVKEDFKVNAKKLGLDVSFDQASSELLARQQIWEIQADITFKNAKKIENAYELMQKQEEFFNNGTKDSYYSEDITIISSHFIFHPRYIDGSEILVDHGLYIFDTAVVKEDVPFIQYRSKTQNYYKIHELKEGTYRDYEKIKLKTSDESNKLYVNFLDIPAQIQIEDKPVDIILPGFTLVYSFANGELNIEIPGKQETAELVRESTIQRVLEVFPLLDLGQSNETKIRGTFRIFEMRYDEISLAHAILNEEPLSLFLFLEEKTVAQCFKARTDIYFRPLFDEEYGPDKEEKKTYVSSPFTVSFALKNKVLEKAEVIRIRGSDQVLRLPSKTEYLHVTVTEAKDIPKLEHFMHFIHGFLGLYSKYRETYFSIYEDAFPNLSLRTGHEEEEEIKQTPTYSLFDLTKQVPDLFVSNVGRRCTKHPKIIEPQDYKKWEETLTKTGEKRQIMMFPKKNPKAYVCPSKDAPYPGLVIVPQSGEVYKKYGGFVPCCFAKDKGVRTGKRASRVNGKETNYTAWFYNREPPKPKHTGITVGKRVSTEGGLKRIPIHLEQLLAKGTADPEIIHTSMLVIDEDKPGLFLREGVPISRNSILHALFIAGEDEIYLESNSEEREEKIRNTRKILAESVNPNLLKQELYDLTNSEITQLLADSDVFLNPALFYRALEEIFDVNIFVLLPEPDDITGNIQIPRNKQFHIRSLRKDRKTVILYMHLGSEFDIAEFPQCELIIYQDRAKNTETSIFDNTMTQILYDTLMEKAGTITWRGFREDFGVVRKMEENIYSVIDYEKLFEEKHCKLHSQHIDAQGKMRALEITYSGREFVAVCMPSQPINLKTMNSDKLTQPYLISLDLVSKLFDEFVICDNQDRIPGVFCTVQGIKECVFIPCEIGENVNKASIFSPLFTPASPTEISSEISTALRVSNIIVQLVKFCFEIFVIHRETTLTFDAGYIISPEEQNVEDFINSYIEKLDEESVAINYYNIDELKPILPKVLSTTDALRVIYENTQNLVVASRVNKEREVLSTLPLQSNINEEYKFSFTADLISKVRNILTWYNEVLSGTVMTYDLDAEPNKYFDNYYIRSILNNFYTRSSDFLLSEHTFVFIGDDDFNSWLSGIIGGPASDKIRDIVTKIYPPKYRYPYFFRDLNDNTISLVQNLETTNKEEAIEKQLELSQEKNPNIDINVLTPINEIALAARETELIRYEIIDNEKVPNKEGTELGRFNRTEINEEPTESILYLGTLSDFQQGTPENYATMLLL